MWTPDINIYFNKRISLFQILFQRKVNYVWKRAKWSKLNSFGKVEKFEEDFKTILGAVQKIRVKVGGGRGLAI